MRRVDGKSNKYKEQTDWLQECDMPHSQSVRLCVLDSEFSMSAKAFGKGGSGGLSDKKAYLQIQHQTPVFTWIQTEHLPSVLDTVYPSSVLTFTWGFVISSALEANIH